MPSIIIGHRLQAVSDLFAVMTFDPVKWLVTRDAEQSFIQYSKNVTSRYLKAFSNTHKVHFYCGLFAKCMSFFIPKNMSPKRNKWTTHKKGWGFNCYKQTNPNPMWPGIEISRENACVVLLLDKTVVDSNANIHTKVPCQFIQSISLQFDATN